MHENATRFFESVARERNRNYDRASPEAKRTMCAAAKVETEELLRTLLRHCGDNAEDERHVEALTKLADDLGIGRSRLLT
jgi:hypothetical protein